MLSTAQIAQYDVINIVKIDESAKVQDPLCDVEIKSWSFSSLCRLCAQESSDVIQIFGEEGLALHLPDIISACLPITVKFLIKFFTIFNVCCSIGESRRRPSSNELQSVYICPAAKPYPPGHSQESRQQFEENAGAPDRCVGRIPAQGLFF